MWERYHNGIELKKICINIQMCVTDLRCPNRMEERNGKVSDSP